MLRKEKYTGLLRYDPSGVFLDAHGIAPADLADLCPRLEAARQEVAEADVRRWADGQVPPELEPLDGAFYRLPEQMLADYLTLRQGSELGRVLSAAAHLQESVDRVVVLGIGGSALAARALMESCVQPYFNELSRGARGGKPRMYFAGNNVDNDAAQALLHLLGDGRAAGCLEDRWAIVVISKSGDTLETAVAFRQFLAALRGAVSGDAARLAERVVPVTAGRGRLFELTQALGCRDVLRVPPGVGGRFSILSAVGLLPAAILGMDVMQLLKGAIAMNEHFRSAAADQNIVLQYAGVCHLMQSQRGAHTRVLSVWAQALEPIGWWYDQLLAESLGKQECGATPLTVVNTRDLHSRAQQHQDGRRDKLFTNLIVDEWRWDALPVGHGELDQDGLNDIAEKTLPELMSAAIQGANEAYRAAGRPTADLHLPMGNEFYLGQLLQMLMLATVVEGRLIGINPYGQPAVDAYKTNVRRILGRR